MAVQAWHLSRGFRVPDDAAAGASSVLFLDDFAARCAPPAPGIGDTTLLRALPRGDDDLLLPSCDYGFEPRKRARVSLPLAAAATAMQEGTATAPGVDDSMASTSGRAGGSARGFLLSSSSRLCDQQAAEIDALVTLEIERMRAGMQDARRRHARALLLFATASAASGSGRLRAAEAELDRALRRNAELEDRVRRAAAECLVWAGIARSHEAVAAGLRAAIDQQLLLQSSCAAAAAVGDDAEADDAQSCCFEAPAADDAASRSRASSCRACCGGEACVLLLPCRHLCLCRACEAAVHACPVCAAAKNASLHVVLA